MLLKFDSNDIFRHYTVYVKGGKTRRLVARATKFCAVVPNIFSVIIAVFSLRPVYEICTSSHAASGKHEITGSQVTPKLWIFSMQFV